MRAAHLEHEVAHPHVAVADGVEARAEGVAGAPQLHQQLEHLVRDLPQLQHVLLNAWKEGKRRRNERGGRLQLNDSSRQRKLELQHESLLTKVERGGVEQNALLSKEKEMADGPCVARDKLLDGTMKL